MGIESINEAKLKERLKSIKMKIPYDKSDQVVKNIASKVTICRRDFITDLNWGTIQEHMPNFRLLEKKMNTTDPQTFLAALDLKMLEALIIKLDERQVQNIYCKPDFAEQFSEMVYQLFKGRQIKSTLSKRLVDGELPREVEIHPYL
mmetsp:Transcript_16452/g.15769  ORF Transcript_16452/g.15769 Transcript_16452/m.15769 type:complete len:147 (+) Transcript_16452:1326-1766(+)